MSSLREQTGYARFVDGKWEPTYTMSTDVVKTVEIGGNSPMPFYLYAALVTRLDMSMREPLQVSLWQRFPYAMYCRAVELIGKDLP